MHSITVSWRRTTVHANGAGGGYDVARVRRFRTKLSLVTYYYIDHTFNHIYFHKKRLSHIVHGPHDKAFHALWQQLRDEHDELARKGYTGEGFLSKGHKVGGRRIPMDEARRQARIAAEKRRVLTAGSGQKLGGTGVRRGADIRKVIADAAQNRIDVTKGCASGTKESKAIVEQATKNGFRTQAEEDDANERAIMEAYIELLQEEEKEKWGDAYVPPSAQNPSGSGGGLVGGKKDTMTSSTAKPARIPSSSKPALPDATPVFSSSSAESLPSTGALSPLWTCSICTLENPMNYLCCDACGTERPETISRIPGSGGSSTGRDTKRPSPSQQATIGNAAAKRRVPSSMGTAATHSEAPPYWVCHLCDTIMESQWWTCSACGAMKLSS